MRIGVPHEGGRLVAATPTTVKRLIGLGYDVVVGAGAGVEARFPDAAYVDVGAVMDDGGGVWGCDVVVAVGLPDAAQVAAMRSGAVLITQVYPAANPAAVEALREQGVTTLALDCVPRISRAQALDVLSTMSNVSGYRAVIEAAEEYEGMFAGLVTAAGKTAPARVFVIGGGVAGLAAIGAAVSLGAEVRAFDVRPEAAEQIESMGATFVQAAAAQQEISTDGYASELSEAQQKATEALYAEQCAWADIVITTALVRGKAPRTLTTAMTDGMRPGSVIVDLAASGGGNAAACVPGERVVTPGGVIVLGYTDLPSRMPGLTSQLYASNIVNLVALMTPGKDGVLTLDLEDPVQRGVTVTHQSVMMWPPPPVAVSAAPAAPAPAPAPTASAPPPSSVSPPPKPDHRGMRTAVGIALAAVLVILALTFSTTTFLAHFTVFALAVVIGYYVISGVSHSLHTPLMAQTNAISGIILVGALLQLGHESLVVSSLAFVAATVASINIFGGFLVSRRMIAMFRRDS